MESFLNGQSISGEVADCLNGVGKVLEILEESSNLQDHSSELVYLSSTQCVLKTHNIKSKKSASASGGLKAQIYRTTDPN
jgi:hypothetical protein